MSALKCPQDELSPFIQCIHDLSLTQVVDQPTRYRLHQKPSLLDLAFVNNPELVQKVNYLPPIGKSDHLLLEIQTSIKKITNRLVRKMFVDYRSIRADLSNVNWGAILERPVEEKWNMFKTLLLDVEKRHTSVRMIPKPKTLPYMTKEIRKERNRKSRYWNKYKKKGDKTNYAKFATARNKLRQLTKQLHLDFESKLADDCKHNPKKFWNYVSSKDHNLRNIKRLVREDNSEATDLLEIAEILNKQFASVFTSEPDGQLPQAPQSNTTNQMTEITVDEAAVLKRLSNLDANKSAGPDNIHPRLLKELASIIAAPLTNIFQSSLDSGIVPSDWKEAYVAPIFKKGDKSKAENYRPISLTSAVAKLLERIVNDAIHDHLTTHMILSNNQHGFRRNKSVETNLLETYNTITKLLDAGVPVDLILLDLAKAFDKVPHRRLRIKLLSAGLNQMTVDWLMNFLTNRTQRVRLFGSGGQKIYSEPCDVISGVPQGTVLGPTLFLIYINDLVTKVSNNVTLFADDSKLFGPADSASLQADLNHIQEWAEEWLLSFNTSKCSVLHFGPKNENAVYSMWDPDKRAQITLQSHTEERDLGVFVDNQLKFHSHTRHVVSKSNAGLGLLKRSITSRSPKVFLRLYKAIVRPNLDFGNCITAPQYKGDTRLIEGVQRRATKVIDGLHDLPYEERLRKLKLPTLVYRRRRGDMLLTHKLYSETSSLLKVQKSNQPHTRGHSKKLPKCHVNTRMRQNFFSERVVNDWNSLSKSTVSATSPVAFKKSLDDEWPRKNWKVLLGPGWDDPNQ